jgi:putative iron-only hydrogenase system regulator
MKKKFGVIGIIAENRVCTAPKVNEILSQYGNVILGRLGVHRKEDNIGIISIIIEATTDTIGALTGKLGMIEGVTVKSAVTGKNKW